MAQAPRYEALLRDARLTQGDIIDDCPMLLLENPERALDGDVEPDFILGRIIVLTQACDLEQSKATKTLVALIHDPQNLVHRGFLKPSTIRDSIRRHQSFGWYFLPAASLPLAFPESIIDLRELHTIHRGILERLIADGKGVCRLSTPYREHLAQHFAVTYMRIALPEPYETEA